MTCSKAFHPSLSARLRDPALWVGSAAGTLLSEPHDAAKEPEYTRLSVHREPAQEPKRVSVVVRREGGE